MSERGYTVKLGARVDAYVAAMKQAEAATAGLASGAEADFKKLGASVRDVGAKAAKELGSTLVAGAKVVGAAAGAALGTSLALGMGRLVAIDDAEAKLRGLGHTAAEIESIMDSAMESVLGTAYGFGEATTVAATAVAAGIEQGEELTEYLKMVGDTAAIAGTSLTEMGGIINKTTTDGRVFTLELRQLADRGLPVFQWLAEAYGVSAEELRKMVSEGQVDAATFRQVLVANIGGAALEMGDSFSGAASNVRAAMSRLGAEILEPFFQQGTTGFAALISVIDELSGVVGPAMSGLGDAFGSTVGRFAEWAEQLTITEDMLGQLADRMEGLAPLAVGVGAALTAAFAGQLPILNNFLGGMNPIVIGVGALIAASPELRSAMGDAFSTIWDAVQPLMPALKEILQSLMSFVETAGSAAIGALGDTLAALLPVIVDLAGIAATLADTVGGPVVGALGEMTSALAGVVGALPPEVLTALVTGVVAFKGAIVLSALAVGAKTAAVGGLTASLGALRASMAAHPIFLLAATAAGVATAMHLFMNRTRDAAVEVRNLEADIRNLRDSMMNVSPEQAAIDRIVELASANHVLAAAMAEAGISAAELGTAFMSSEFNSNTAAVTERLLAAAEATGATDEQMAVLRRSLALTNSEIFVASTEAAQLARSLGETDAAAHNAAGGIDDLGGAVQRSADDIAFAAGVTEGAAILYQASLDEIQQAADELANRVDSAFSSAASSMLSFSDEGKKSLGSFHGELLQSIWDLTIWQNNLITIAERGSAEAALQFAELGPGFAGPIAELANTTDTEFAAVMSAMLGYTEAGQRDMGAEFAKVDPEFKKTFDGLAGMTGIELVKLQIKASQEAFKIGTALTDGVGAGVVDRSPALQEAVRKAIRDAIEAGKDEAETGSPSRLFARELGEPISQGVAQGIDNESHRVVTAMLDAIDRARTEAQRAIDDMLRDIERQVGDVWSSIDDRRNLEQLEASVADATDRLSEARANAAEALAEHGRDSDEYRAALDRVEDAEKRLEDANYRLLKAMEDAYLQGEISEQQFRDLAKAAGVERREIDDLVASLDELAAARQRAAADSAALDAQAGHATTVTNAFNEWANVGAFSQAEMDRVAELQRTDPAAALAEMERLWLRQDATLHVPGRAIGGPVMRNRIYEVNEANAPGELFETGGRQYLLAARQGHITPLHAVAQHAAPASTGGGSSEMTHRVQVDQMPPREYARMFVREVYKELRDKEWAA